MLIQSFRKMTLGQLAGPFLKSVLKEKLEDSGRKRSVLLLFYDNRKTDSPRKGTRNPKHIFARLANCPTPRGIAIGATRCGQRRPRGCYPCDLARTLGLREKKNGEK